VQAEENVRGRFWRIFSQPGRKPFLAFSRIFSSNIQREWVSRRYHFINNCSARKRVKLIVILCVIARMCVVIYFVIYPANEPANGSIDKNEKIHLEMR
jgi:hypothetical protein